MTPALFHLANLSIKVALLGAMLWSQLYFLRRAPAQLRSRLCFATFSAIPVLAAIQVWISTGGHAGMLSAPLMTFAFSATSAARATGSQPAMNWIFYAWIFGAVLMLSRLLAGRAALYAVYRNSLPADRLDQGAVEVRVAPVQSPVLAGLVHPRILVPPAYTDWTRSQQEMVLLHELNHFRQADHIAILLAQVVRAMLWFHPVAWMLAARLSREQELACDEAVVAAGHSPHDYAEFLLETVRGLTSTALFSCSMAGSGTSSVKLRFARLLDTRPRSRRRGVLPILVAALAMFVIAATAVTPIWSQSETSKTGKVYRVGNGVLPPKLLQRVQPDYTEDAKTERIEGAVILAVTVTVEGKADNITLVRSLNPGLDQKAIDAVTQWVFAPGTKDGEPVAVRATIEINFRLK